LKGDTKLELVDKENLRSNEQSANLVENSKTRSSQRSIGRLSIAFRVKASKSNNGMKDEKFGREETKVEKGAGCVDAAKFGAGLLHKFKSYSPTPWISTIDQNYQEKTSGNSTSSSSTIIDPSVLHKHKISRSSSPIVSLCENYQENNSDNLSFSDNNKLTFNPVISRTHDPPPIDSNLSPDSRIQNSSSNLLI